MFELATRFWGKVNSSGECWLWTGSRDNLGYGRIGIGRVPRLAHRVAYELIVGEIPLGHVIDHVCKNASCVNPKHLRVCLQAENIRNSKPHKDNKSGFKGVYLLPKTGKYIARIQLNGKKITIGRYDTPEDAHDAYALSAIRIHGDFAHTL